MLKGIWFGTMVLALSAVLLSGCKSEEAQPKAVSQSFEISTEPVTLKLFVAVPGLTDNDYKTLIEQPLKKKYPFITLQMIRPVEGQMMPDLIAAGTVPDLMYGHFGHLTNYHRDLEAIAELTPLIKKI
jgi:multiple sugar transport system substrate-binding protein